jgi:hypothetical protein
VISEHARPGCFARVAFALDYHPSFMGLPPPPLIRSSVAPSLAPLPRSRPPLRS